MNKVRELIEFGAKLNIRDDARGWSPLHEAAYFGFINVVRVLIQHGANFDIKDKGRRTPLQLANFYCKILLFSVKFKQKFVKLF